MKIIGIDCETHDPLLKVKGTSWVFNEGELLCTALYNSEKKTKKVYFPSNDTVNELLGDENVTLVGANIGYDLGWLTYHHNFTGHIKASLVDVEVAESHIDEYARTNLDELGKKYLGYGKKKSKLEEWAENEGLKGDVRQHLKKACEEVPKLVEEYVKEDAAIACLVWEKQKEVLERRGTLEPVLRDFKMIPILLLMKRNGAPIDKEEKEKSRKYLQGILDELNTSFVRKYGEVNIKSPKQLKAFFDKHDMPYKYKITIKTFDGENVDKANAYKIRKYLSENIVSEGFITSKGKVIGLYDERYITRICSRLDKHGFTYICNPTIDAKWRAKIAVNYPIAAEMQDIAKATDILSKILGVGYDKYIAPDGRVHPNFNISKRDTATDETKGKQSGTKTGRLSSDMPNGQNIPSKGELFAGTDKEIKIVPLCRRMFIAEKDCWAMKIDYSQIEYRLLAHFAVGEGAAELRAQFNKNPHTDYHKFVEDISGLSRKYAKNLNFGIMYGMRIKTMLDTFGWDAETGQKLWDTYHAAMPFVSPTMKLIGETALGRATGVIKRAGRIVSYDKGSAWIRLIGGRQLHMESASDTYLMLNKLNQGSAAVILKEAMIEAYEEGLFDKLKLHLQVHDELFLSVPKTFECFTAAMRLQYLMENTTKIKVPILAEPEFGENWHDVPYSLSYDDTGKFVQYEGEKMYYTTDMEAFNILKKLDKQRKVA